MSDTEAFHEKIARLKPTDHDTKPNTFWVGILKLDREPGHELVQADCLWAKCGKNKDISKIRKAYMSIEAPDEDIVLRHGFRTAGYKCLEDNVLVNTMNTRGDDVVALWAIRRSELGPRMVKEERAPLQNITNTAAGPKPTPGNVKAEERESRLSMTTLATEMSNPDLVKCTAAQDSENIELAWVDFNCERREFLQRVNLRSAAQEVEEMDDRVRIEWLRLSDGQIKFFEKRAHRIGNRLSGPGTSFIQRFASSSRGFWAYYYDEFHEIKRNGLEPHRSFESTQLFFDSVLNRWLPMASGAQSTWIVRNLAFLQRNPIRPMPVRSAEDQEASTSAVKGESRPEKEAGLEPRDRLVNPSATLEVDVNPAVSRSTSPPSIDDQVVSTRLNIPDLFAGCTPEQLEKGVEKGVAILDRLKLSLAPKNDSEPTEAGQWLQSIDNVRKQAVRTRTVIGVVGNTGAGKSSVINALLDEERLLPTNCMRACTAVITEISYNYDGTAYSAEIEFIAAKDWRVELETLFKDLLDGSGNISKDCTNEDSEAGIAYAKIKAVYPKLTREDISNSSVEELMKHANVSALLGSSRAIKETDSLIFYRKLQSFVDSKEKTTKSEKDKSDKERRKPREMEYWPLIKVVRLYVRSPALSTGAVIVDLPGVHDSNQARAAVAQNYMKQCTGLWICAPINRAVDDKAAKSLLGETFKRQLKMDGGYSTVTFICSKTDDISLMEAQDSLGIEDELAVLWNKCDELSRKKQSLKKEIEKLKETKSDYAHAMESADEELEVWEKLKDDFDDGKTVYPPALETKGSEKKRKRGKPKKTSNKKARLDDSDDDFIDDSQSEPGHSSDEDSEIESGNEEPAEPLTEEKILEKIGDLRATKKDGRLQRAQLDSEIKNVRALMDECGKDYDAAEAVIFQKCIQGRNEYSKGAIQQDFAAGIKELDMEIQEEEDAAHFNPEADVRDYDEVARSLPVFTVSSRAYQKLMGRLLKDKAVPGFATIQETQIPQLQEHAKKTTEAGRQANCRRFLNSLSQLHNSLRLWAGSDGSSSNLTELQKSQEAKILRNKLSKLDSDLEKSIQALCASLTEEVQENIFEHFATAIQQATSEAASTVDRWGQKVNHDDRAAGGYFWATYKALCRRDGVFSNAQGLHDWNTQLTEPIIKNIANGWERTFSRRMPSVLNGLANKNGALLAAFHEAIETRAMRNGTSLASLEMLKQQLPTYKDTFKDLSAVAQTQITTRQKDINREFVPVVAEAMKQAYDDCENERGPGQYARMKAMMSRHVEGVRHQMFSDSTNAVQKLLRKLIKDIEDFLLEKADQVFISVKRDYESVVLGRQAATHQLPREQRQVRADVNNIVEGTELIFKQAVGLEPETPEQAVEDLEEKNAPAKAEEAVQDVTTDGIENAEDAKNDIETEADIDDETGEDDNASVEQTTEATTEATTQQDNADSNNHPTESATLRSPVAHTVVLGTRENGSPSAHEPASPYAERTETLVEASNGVKICTATDNRIATRHSSGGEKELLESRSMSANELNQEVDCEAAESSLHDERSSSVLSWVQSWFSPHE